MTTKTTYVIQEYWPKAGRWMEFLTSNERSEADETFSDVAPFSLNPMRMVQRVTTVVDTVLDEEENV